MSIPDSLGSRIKERFEDRTRFYLPRRTFAVVRVDGRAFHTFTRGCARPYDQYLMNTIDMTAMAMCKEMAGAVCAYSQSDEISVLLCDFRKQDSDGWFDYNIQKMASISASLATAHFNQFYDTKNRDIQPALFDARVFSIPDPVEVLNYFIWRQKDAERNSLQMAAQALFSHRELHGRSCKDLHEMLHTKGVNWNDYTVRQKRGGFMRKQEDRWTAVDVPILAKDQDYFLNLLPKLGYEE